jgi:hypothetical protein
MLSFMGFGTRSTQGPHHDVETTHMLSKEGSGAPLCIVKLCGATT